MKSGEKTDEQDMKNIVKNTTASAEADPGAMLLEMLVLGGVEGQEVRGQEQLLRSETLPAKCDRDSRVALEAAGVVFGKPVEGDPLFVYATLPAGWKKVGTSHSMHSSLVDERGRKRGSIFYKAAFYDRSASIYACRRFSTRLDYSEPNYSKGIASAAVYDGDREIFRTEQKTFPTRKSDEARAYMDKCEKDASDWLVKRYPNYEDPGAYWDLPEHSSEKELA